ncbi:PAS domain-containing protein [Marivita sp. GX14005]|uniref:PAS domain-containing protein n=1 Tax=Marivita sp. GX14005 TaxID=2942276 RepID=UPI002019CCF5|nr:PAS domain-containing protein [Marivita sp. GX14005]MCL3882654.1 PAS domain-containing protein [Marivita sp. GX14005]
MSGSLQHEIIARHQTRAARIVERYWCDLAAQGAIPERARIDPAEIQDALEYAFIAEHLDCGHARLRVAGGAVSAVLGMETTGMPLSVLIAPAARDRFNGRVARVFQGPARLVLKLHAHARYGQPPLEAEMRLYPLRGVSGRVTQSLGTFLCGGQIGRAPRRFDLGSVTEQSARAPAPTFAPIRQHGHLRLVVSN